MWDQRYSEPGYAYGTSANDFLQQQYTNINAGGGVLCLAEGEGRNAVFLAKHGYRVTAVDQSAVGLDKANALAADNGVSIDTVVADLADYDPGKDCWDGIVSISAHVPRGLRRRLHRDVVDALVPGGVLLLEAYTPRHLEMSGVGGPPASQPDMFMPLQELEAELDGLEFVIGREIERDMAEGRFHQGASAVVQVLARKPLR